MYNRATFYINGVILKQIQAIDFNVYTDIDKHFRHMQVSFDRVANCKSDSLIHSFSILSMFKKNKKHFKFNLKTGFLFLYG